MGKFIVLVSCYCLLVTVGAQKTTENGEKHITTTCIIYYFVQPSCKTLQNITLRPRKLNLAANIRLSD